MILHIISKNYSNFSDNLDLLELSKTNNNDAIIFIGEGSFSLASKKIYSILENNQSANSSLIYAINDDIKARGLINKIPANTKLISYEVFVELVLKFDKNITW